MSSVFVEGIKTIIASIPVNERYMFIDMLDSFNPFESIDRHYLIPIELYCDKCGIRYRGYDNENVKSSLLKIDVLVNQKEDGTIEVGEDISNKWRCLWHILNSLSIRMSDDVIEYSFHQILYPYIIAYHIMKQGGI